ncbi:MAG: hypothetical protein AB7Q37_10975 [Pyrinomonadaceae bacterium]
MRIGRAVGVAVVLYAVTLASASLLGFQNDSGRNEPVWVGIKQRPRENEERLRRNVLAMKLYFEDYPDADRKNVLSVYARGSGYPVGVLAEELEKLQLAEANLVG